MKGLHNEIEKYCIREYAHDSIYIRHDFKNILKDSVGLNNNVEHYASYFLHLVEITEYFNTHKNEKGKNTIEGYRGSVYSPDFKIDIDEKETALDKVRSLLKHWASVYELDLKQIKVNFSGSKGFHIRIPSILFGDFQPSDKLPLLHDGIAYKLTNNLVTIDESVYGHIGLFREVNSINKKSGLFAIPLTIEEVLNLTYEEIKDLAKSQREVDYLDEDELIPNDNFIAIVNDVIKENSSDEGSNGKAKNLMEKLKNQKVLYIIFLVE